MKCKRKSKMKFVLVADKFSRKSYAGTKWEGEMALKQNCKKWKSEIEGTPEMERGAKG